MKPIAFRILVLLGAIVTAQGATAASIVYSDQASFNSAVGAGLTIEDFDDEVTGGVPASPISLSGTALTQIATSANQIFRIDSPAGVSGQGLSIQSTGSYLATFTFSTGMQAFGLHILDLFEGSNQTVSFTTDGGDSGLLFSNTTPLPNLNLQFLGFTTDTAFTSVTLNMINTFSDGSEWDTVSFAETTEAVPAPLAPGMLLVGLALLLRRRAS